MSEHEEDDYTGEATLLLDDVELPVTVRLRGHFQPIDGYYHWYGRVSASDRVSELAGGRKKKVEIRTEQGTASGELSDPDPWDRYRIMGTSTPPFTVPTALDQLEDTDHPAQISH
ncbi:DUF4873 domain-containing protein [Prauserella marina]|uniref:Uncharacterized protein n=1 Tax=Prauserella marina TaxID=530584 RepID=A0A222VK84_9PSEU|nr:DUF4873 domain-containing protein [Prauserella marina]ASR34336.1 DUF4873 domain-containing protein [Prauserella marina]PWV71875.1 uncharacterized protein DUF4873 [Prauserella marina]SDD89805.1 protein of unknown function [Prauserella marina]